MVPRRRSARKYSPGTRSPARLRPPWVSLCGARQESLQKAAVAAVASDARSSVLYAALGMLLAVVFSRVSPAAELHRDEAQASAKSLLGIASARGVVFRLSGLFAIDAFGGGFVVQSFAAYWFYLRFGVSPAALGGIFFGANLFAGISALLASRIAARIGLVRTMVFTHLPSNVLLILVPLMPTLPLAIAVLLLRFSISQMDVPTRQSLHMAVVPPRRTLRGGGSHGRSAHHGRRHRSDVRRAPVRAPFAHQSAVLHRRHAQDCLRPAPLSRLRRSAHT